MRPAFFANLCPPVLAPLPFWGNVSGMVLDANAEKLAVKYFPTTTSPITAIDLLLNVVGDASDVNWRFQVESSSSDAPSGSVLGAATNEFAGPAATGWTGSKSLVSNTGSLTLGAPVWVVLYRSSGSSLSGSKYVQLKGAGNNHLSFNERGRHHNGTNWTTTSPSTSAISIMITHQDGTIVGCPITAGYATSGTYESVANIYGSNKQGIKLRAGCKLQIPGVSLRITKNGSPADLEISIYQGSTLKFSGTVLASEIVSGLAVPVYFGSPTYIDADADTYIIAAQSGGGGDASNYYAFSVYQVNSSYMGALGGDHMRLVHGTSSDPTALTVASQSFPYGLPMVDIVTDLDSAAGGGLLTHPGMSGGMRG